MEILARPGQVYRKVAVIHFVTAIHTDGFLGFSLSGHFDKREPFRPAGVAVFDQRHRGDGARLSK